MVLVGRSVSLRGIRRIEVVAAVELKLVQKDCMHFITAKDIACDAFINISITDDWIGGIGSVEVRLN